MQDNYSAQTRCNLLSWPVTRFADHLSAVSEPPGGSSCRRQHYFGSRIYQSTDCNLFPSYYLSACKNDLDLATLKCELQSYRYLRTTIAAAAQGGM